MPFGLKPTYLPATDSTAVTTSGTVTANSLSVVSITASGAVSVDSLTVDGEEVTGGGGGPSVPTFLHVGRIDTEQSLTFTTTATVVFDTTFTSKGSPAIGYDTETGVFTVPQAGIYEISAGAIIDTSVTDRPYSLWAHVNSGEGDPTEEGYTIGSYASPDPDAFAAINGTLKVALAANDTIEIKLYKHGGVEALVTVFNAFTDNDITITRPSWAAIHYIGPSS